MNKPQKTFNEVFGERLRFFREKMDITQIDLAYALGYQSTATISQIETGRRGMSKDMIYKAAKYLGVHPALLMSEKEFDAEKLEMICNFMRLLENGNKDHNYYSIKSILEITSSKSRK